MNWKIYIINLDTAVIRRNFMKSQLKKLKIDNYEIIDAVSAVKMGEEWLQTQVNREELVRHMTGGEIACTLSHKKALEKFLRDKDVDYAVVLEDDATLPKDFKKSIEDSISYIKEDDVMLLAGSVQEPFEYNAVRSLGDNRVILKPVKATARVFSAAAYIMSKKVAEKHIKSLYPITDVTDSWQHYRMRGSMDNIYLAHPFVVDQEVFQSSRDIRSLKNTIINWILYHKVPVLYSFFRKRRRRAEDERLKNIHVIG